MVDDHDGENHQASSFTLISDNGDVETEFENNGQGEQWWQTKPLANTPRAIAYYRHSAQEKQKNSVELQAEQVRAYACENSIRIIHEFADRGRSGVTGNRPAFQEMLCWVRERNDFQYILIPEISRMGRFQDNDLFGYYELECRRNGKEIRFVTQKIPDEGPAGTVLKAVYRFQSAEESRIRSDKVFRGSIKVAKQGYRAGGSAPYGFARALFDEKDAFKEVLHPGQKKAIANQRVRLTPGDSNQVETVQEIFARFVEEGLDERQIAGQLNIKGISSPGGAKWSPAIIGKILRDQQYAGAVVYNRTSQKLQKDKVRNPPQEWVVTPGAFPGLIPEELYFRAQERFKERQRRLGSEEMLSHLQRLYERFGIVTRQTLHADSLSPSTGAYSRSFGSISLAFQRLFADVLGKTRDELRSKIAAEVAPCAPHEDFVVVDQRMTILIQPSIPVPNGYGRYWVFKPDKRPNIDITLGVPLSQGEEYRILGYFPFPRIMLDGSEIHLTTSSHGLIGMYGHIGLDILKEMLQCGNPNL